MKPHSGLIAAGDKLTLACSCEAEVIVPLIIMLPRHHVVRILTAGQQCRVLHHRRGDRVVVRWDSKDGDRIFGDIHAA
jgi:hypothetical protein